MIQTIRTHTINVTLTSYGDALLFGQSSQSEQALTGLQIKHQLFTWHEASFYGTDLEIQSAQDLELVLLPSEQVIPFFAEHKLLKWIEWEWNEQASLLIKLAPQLTEQMEKKNYVPHFSAFQNGQIRWTWDESKLPFVLQQLLKEAEADLPFKEGLQAAFSTAVNAMYYVTEEAAADLRRDFPLLFAKDQRMLAGLNAQSWLVAIGWKSDEAPFRPLLQLLEPEGDTTEWQLRLMLQDKQDLAKLIPVELASSGEINGEWPSTWSNSIQDRSAGWLKQLRACLPFERLAGTETNLLCCPMESEAAWQFLSVDSNRLLEAGGQVLLPAWWEALNKRKPRLRAKIKAESSQSNASLFGLDSLITFDWRVAIGDLDMTEEEFAELASRNERLARFRGQWVALDPSMLMQIRRLMASVDSSKGLSFQDVLQLHLLNSSTDTEDIADTNAEPDERIRPEVELNEHLLKLMKQLSQLEPLPIIPLPTDLQAELRTYQHEGYSWLAFLRQLGLGACLADDMGLGKTVQLIAYLLHVKHTYESDRQAGPSLIICPTSVLGNWQKEIARFAPSLSVIIHYGSKRLQGDAFYDSLKQADVVLTSYSTASLDQELLQGCTWSTIGLDEAQNIKNAQTKQSTTVRSIPALHRIALTGTPIENRLSELWSIYDFINPGFLGSANGFQKRFAQAIEKDQNAERTFELQKLVQPFMLRRKKNDPAIQLALPDKNEMKSFIPLTAEQGALYDQTVNQLMERMQKLEGIQRKGAILSTITHLKQICDHPLLLTKESSFDLEANTNVEETLETWTAQSAKLERLLAMVKELREEGERCLIFTQYLGMGQIIQSALQHELQEPVLYLNGSTSKTARDRMIAQFQAQPSAQEEAVRSAKQPAVFILSIKAGGVGLNLTAANHVFHFDRWWNPAVENQATDRAYRIGQTRDVQVHKFISLGTLEERIDDMLEQKQHLSDSVVASSEGWITELSTDELRDLFTWRQSW